MGLVPIGFAGEQIICFGYAKPSMYFHSLHHVHCTVSIVRI